MKVKILSCLKKTLWYCNEVGQEFEVTYDVNNCHSNTQFRCIKDKKLFFNIEDIVITELPTLFCVENYRDINKEKWLKYIWWLNQNYNANSDGSLLSYYGINNENKAVILSNPIGIEMHIDDIIKHIDYMEDINKNKTNEMSEEFDMSTNEGRLAYAIKYYPIGTTFKNPWGEIFKTKGLPKIWGVDIIEVRCENDKDVSIYRDYKWAEIINDEKKEFLDGDGKPFVVGDWYRILDKDDSCKSHRRCYKSPTSDELIFREWTDYCRNYFISNKDLSFKNLSRLVRVSYLEVEEYIRKKEDKMENQKLSRKGLKEIHSVACTRWKEALEHYGTRNPLEDYIELSEQEVETMFKECTKEQLPIVSKYLKQDDGSIDLTNIKTDRSGFILNDAYIIRQDDIEYDKKSFWLNNDFKWEIKNVDGLPRLYPTKKK